MNEVLDYKFFLYALTLEAYRTSFTDAMNKSLGLYPTFQ